MAPAMAAPALSPVFIQEPIKEEDRISMAAILSSDSEKRKKKKERKKLKRV